MRTAMGFVRVVLNDLVFSHNKAKQGGGFAADLYGSTYNQLLSFLQRNSD